MVMRLANEMTQGIEGKSINLAEYIKMLRKKHVLIMVKKKIKEAIEKRD
jgi:hypothetical protein